MKPEPKLEPLACPFCGSELIKPEDAGYNGLGYMRCQDCWAAGPEVKGKHVDGIAAWNTRTPASEPTEAQVEAAAKVICCPSGTCIMADCNAVCVSETLHNMARAALKAALVSSADVRAVKNPREVAEMVARFRTPPGLNWKPLADDIETVIATVRRQALEEAAKVAETLRTLDAALPTGPNGEWEYKHATKHGEQIAAAIRALAQPAEETK